MREPSPERSTRRSGSSACKPKVRRPSIAPGARDAGSSPKTWTRLPTGWRPANHSTMPLALLPRLVDEIMLVSDDEIAAAIRLLIETARQVAEGAGAATLAAAIEHRDDTRRQERRLDLERRQHHDRTVQADHPEPCNHTRRVARRSRSWRDTYCPVKPRRSMFMVGSLNGFLGGFFFLA